MVWLIESACNEDLQGSFCTQIGSLFWLSFTTLFPIHGEKLRSNLSRVAMVVWLFVALVLTQSYTASLTSMLTVSQLRPAISRGSVKVGCDKDFFVVSYLVKVLHFEKSLINTYTSGKDYAEALRIGEIQAAFLELAFSQTFLQENKGFTAIGPTFRMGGYGFVFPKGSSLAGMVSEEIMRLRESGELQNLETNYGICSPSESLSSSRTDGKNGSLSPESFWVLFLITGGTSTLAFLLFQFSRLRENWRRKKQSLAPWLHERICILIPPDTSKRVPHMVTGTAPDRSHNSIQVHEFRRSNTF